MELILISSNKLKVILSKEEVEKYKLSSDCNISHISEKKQLNLLLDDIKIKSGFDTDSGSIYIEMFESLLGGCEIFITKEMHKLSPSRSEIVKKSVKESILTYKFTSVESLILAAKRLTNTNILCKSRLFYDEYGAFYLTLTFREGFNSKDDVRLIFMDEYCEKIQGANIRDYLEEHGNIICKEDSTAILSSL